MLDGLMLCAALATMPAMGQNAETKIQNAALLAVGQRADVMPMRLQSGMFRRMDAPDQMVRVGQPGMADTMLIVSVEITEAMVGKRIAVPVAAEFKTDTGRQSEQQKRWQAAFTARGGIYAVVRSVGEVLGLVEKVQRGEF